MVASCQEPYGSQIFPHCPLQRYNFFLKCAVFFTVIKLLLQVVVVVDNLVVDNLAVLFNGNDVGVDESAVRLQVQSLVTLLDLLVEGRVDVYGVVLNQVLACLVVTLGLDALNLGQEFGKEGAQLYIVVDHKVGLAVAYLLFDDVVLGTLLVAPLGNELAVLHVGLGVGTSQLHAGELNHQTVADVVGVLGLVGILVGHDTQLNHLGIGCEIESEQVGAGLLQGRCVLTHGCA